MFVIHKRVSEYFEDGHVRDCIYGPYETYAQAALDVIRLCVRHMIPDDYFKDGRRCGYHWDGGFIWVINCVNINEMWVDVSKCEICDMWYSVTYSIKELMSFPEVRTKKKHASI